MGEIRFLGRDQLAIDFARGHYGLIMGSCVRSTCLTGPD
jgi:hypothetical protein